MALEGSTNLKEVRDSWIRHGKSLGMSITRHSDRVVQVDDDLSDDVYPLEVEENGRKEKKHGLVLIMSNSFRTLQGKGRRVEASDKDVKNMTEFWRDRVGCKLFEVKEDGNQLRATEGEQDDEEDRRRTREKLKSKNKRGAYEDVDAEEMFELLKSLSEIKEKFSYIVVVISTHGKMLRGIDNSTKDHQVFYGEDFKSVSEKEVIELFYNDKNENLKGIPKFFILDYCRYESVESPKGPDVENSELLSVLPLRSDFVIAYATHHSHYAFEDKEGSWLTSAIANVFGNYYQGRDVVNMLTKVNAEVHDLCVRRKRKAMSVFESSLLMEFRLTEFGVGQKEKLERKKAIPFGSQGEASSSAEEQPRETSESNKRKREAPPQEGSNESGSSTPSSPKQRKS